MKSTLWRILGIALGLATLLSILNGLKSLVAYLPGIESLSTYGLAADAADALLQIAVILLLGSAARGCLRRAQRASGARPQQGTSVQDLEQPRRPWER